jgi:hypothetical protein
MDRGRRRIGQEDNATHFVEDFTRSPLYGTPV